MRHLLIATALVLGALLATATIAAYLENQATTRNNARGDTYTPPDVPAYGKPTPPEQSRSLNVVWRRSGK